MKELLISGLWGISLLIRFRDDNAEWMLTLEVSLTMCPVRNSPILSETSVWAEWFLYLGICNRKPILTSLGMHRLLSPYSRESRVRIPTLASLLIFLFFFPFCFPFFLSITLTNPWALVRFCSLPLHFCGYCLLLEAKPPCHRVESECNNRIRMTLPTLTRLLPDIAQMCSASDVSVFTTDSTAKEGDVSTSQLAMQEGSCIGDWYRIYCIQGPETPMFTPKDKLNFERKQGSANRIWSWSHGSENNWIIRRTIFTK